METTELRAALEAILFLSGEPVKVDDLAEAFSDEGREAIVAQLDEIKRILDTNIGGFMLEQTAGGWRLATRAEHDPILKKYFSRKSENRLSIAALETLAIVAYRQPITAPEVSEIRGVNTTGVIRTLLERRMIRVAGRKNVVGSPFLYRTTKDFLVHFGLNDIRDLPRLEEFGDLIGEQIGDDLVAAIERADVGGEGTPVIDEDNVGTASEEEAAAGDVAVPDDAPADVTTRDDAAPDVASDDASPTDVATNDDEAAGEIATNDEAATDVATNDEESAATNDAGEVESSATNPSDGS